MTLSSLPRVTPLSVTAKQSAAKAWVCVLPTRPRPMALLPSLPTMTFLCFHRDKLLTHLDALRGPLCPASARGKPGLLFVPLTALLRSCPALVPALSHCSDLSTSPSHPLRGQGHGLFVRFPRRQHSAWHTVDTVDVLSPCLTHSHWRHLKDKQCLWAETQCHRFIDFFALIMGNGLFSLTLDGLQQLENGPV